MDRSRSQKDRASVQAGLFEEDQAQPVPLGIEPGTQPLREHVTTSLLKAERHLGAAIRCQVFEQIPEEVLEKRIAGFEPVARPQLKARR